MDRWYCVVMNFDGDVCIDDLTIITTILFSSMIIIIIIIYDYDFYHYHHHHHLGIASSWQVHARHGGVFGRQCDG